MPNRDSWRGDQPHTNTLNGAPLTGVTATFTSEKGHPVTSFSNDDPDVDRATGINIQAVSNEEVQHVSPQELRARMHRELV